MPESKVVLISYLSRTTFEKTGESGYVFGKVWYRVQAHSAAYLTGTALVDLQLDAQNSYLFTYNTFIKILYMFRALPYSSSGRLRRNCIYAASGIVTLCR